MNKDRAPSISLADLSTYAGVVAFIAQMSQWLYQQDILPQNLVAEEHMPAAELAVLATLITSAVLLYLDLPGEKKTKPKTA